MECDENQQQQYPAQMTDNKSKPGKSYLNDSLGDSTANKSNKRKVDGVEVSQTGTSTLSVYNQSAVSSIGLETCDILWFC